MVVQSTPTCTFLNKLMVVRACTLNVNVQYATQRKNLSKMLATSGSSPAEPEALKHSFSYLVNSIDTAALLPVALSRNLITDRQRTECYNEADQYKKAETFVGYLQRAVNAEYDNFYTFVQILKETGQAQIASRLRG